MKIRLLSVLTLCMAAPIALAVDISATLTVNATVIDSCTVSNQTVSFTGYDPVADTGNAAQADISVTCSNGTGYDIALDGGGNAVGSQRNMSDGSNTLAYNLYQDAGFTTAWDAVSVVSNTGTGGATAHTVYAEIPTQATAAVSTLYTDSVTITVTY